jgi:hypothetical protein
MLVCFCRSSREHRRDWEYFAGRGDFNLRRASLLLDPGAKKTPLAARSSRVPGAIQMPLISITITSSWAAIRCMAKPTSWSFWKIWSLTRNGPRYSPYSILYGSGSKIRLGCIAAVGNGAVLGLELYSMKTKS